MILLLLAAAGGVGAGARFVIDGFVARHNPFRTPMGTLLINVSGSLLLGLLTGWAATRAADFVATDLKAVVGTGFCGGYTTFSTSAVETVRLWLSEGRRIGSRYAGITLIGSIAAAAAGLWLGGLL